jgi:hypothetical protein
MSEPEVKHGRRRVTEEGELFALCVAGKECVYSIVNDPSTPIPPPFT